MAFNINVIQLPCSLQCCHEALGGHRNRRILALAYWKTENCHFFMECEDFPLSVLLQDKPFYTCKFQLRYKIVKYILSNKG